MAELKILHNPRCSKSRQTLTLLQEKGYDPVVVEYLKQPLNEATPPMQALPTLHSAKGTSSR